MSLSPMFHLFFDRDMSYVSNGNLSYSHSCSEAVSGNTFNDSVQLNHIDHYNQEARMSKSNLLMLSVIISQTQEYFSVRSDGTKKSSHISSPKLNHTFGRDMSKESDGNISDSCSYSKVVSGRLSERKPFGVKCNHFSNTRILFSEKRWY